MSFGGARLLVLGSSALSDEPEPCKTAPLFLVWCDRGEVIFATGRLDTENGGSCRACRVGERCLESKEDVVLASCLSALFAFKCPGPFELEDKDIEYSFR